MEPESKRRGESASQADPRDAHGAVLVDIRQEILCDRLAGTRGPLRRLDGLEEAEAKVDDSKKFGPGRFTCGVWRGGGGGDDWSSLGLNT
mgnify:CR=1 FL=1